MEIGPADLLPRLKDNGYDVERVGRRRAWVERKTGSELPHIGSGSWDSEMMRGNIENPIGVAQVPMGVAGPVLINGQNAKGLFYVPMATSEGALIRSYERGMVALTKCGGVQTALLADENQTAPTFFFADVEKAAAFPAWIEEKLPELKEAAAATTRHGKLNGLKCYQTGRQVVVNFRISHRRMRTGHEHDRAGDRCALQMGWRRITRLPVTFLFSGDVFRETRQRLSHDAR